MKVILYMATTTNGFIGLPDGNSDWVADADYIPFLKTMKKCGVVIMGRKTYEVNKEDFPFKGVLNIVLTRNNKLLKQNRNVLFTNKKPKEIINLLLKKGCKQAMLIGGREMNSAFLEEGLIDEIFLSIHPLIFRDGMEIFSESSEELKLKLLSVNKLLQDLVQLHYKVIK